MYNMAPGGPTGVVEEQGLVPLRWARDSWEDAPQRFTSCCLSICDQHILLEGGAEWRMKMALAGMKCTVLFFMSPLNLPRKKLELKLSWVLACHSHQI